MSGPQSPRRSGVSRRQWLTSMAASATGTALFGRRMLAESVVIPVNRATRQMTPAQWLPDPPPADEFRRLALAAMESARSAGADEADIRIGVQRSVNVPDYPWPPNIGLLVGYGIRACVGGTWSFQHGNLLTTDAVVSAARRAVAGARLSSKVGTAVAGVTGQRHGMSWAPAPVVTSEWHIPVEIDPFTIPFDDYHRVLAALVDTTSHVYRNLRIGTGLGWQGETRIFASMAGSLIAQETMVGGPGVGGGATLPENRTDSVNINVPKLATTLGGFELALRSDWVSHLMQGVDDAVRWRELPRKRFNDVGRFPIVFDGEALSNLVGMTISQALDGDRLSGAEADASGRTFLTPATDILGAEAPYFSPLLTIRCDRQAPSPMAMRWDDDGVAIEPYTIVDHGRIVDYHTTRATAPLLKDWYAKHGKPVRSHGGCVAAAPASRPMGSGGHLHVTPSATRSTPDELIRDMPHGFYIRGGGVDPDPGLSAGRYNAYNFVAEIQRGVPVARILGIPMQFRTKQLFQKQLVALGDATTVRTAVTVTTKGIPWQGILQQVTAPAALFKDVDVIPRIPLEGAP